ncbi:MAG TPA: hypothetical protein VJR05_15840 [Acidimicrobiia bacterium]|nr:hypothetical protein [Acidimicrobiia bacterium]
MKTLAILFGALVVFTVVMVAAGAPDTQPVGYDRWQVMSEHSQQEMLDNHQGMMEQMRAAYMPQMEGIMRSDPMRTHLNADMIRLMEQNQAEIDRMLARR